MNNEQSSPPTGTTGAPDAAGAVGRMQLVTLELAGERCAVDIHAVREINRLTELTRVPKCPAEIAGVINLRGKILPVVNLREVFAFPRAEWGDQARIVVLEHGSRETGVIVDRVHEVLRVDSALMDPTPVMMRTVDTSFISGIAKLRDRLLIVLDLERLFRALNLADLDLPGEAA